LNVICDIHLLKGRDAVAEQVVIVTGGARGLGLAIAERFAGEEATVVVADRDGDELAKAAAGIGADDIVCDVTSRSSVQALVDETVARHGRLDVLVANAGIGGGGGPASFLEVSDESWQRVIDVNLTGVFLCDQIAGRQLVAQGGGGSIINMSSIMGTVPLQQTVAYGAAKAGVTNLTKTAALTLAPHGVRVNAIGPGFMETRLTEPLRSDPSVAEAVEASVAMKRFGAASEVADAAVFLASDQATYITGQVLYVDGGWLLRPPREQPDDAQK
jgi:NAD(P)-dependent dehydrogenase (short-subunit alcohol dehydrogenase family)